MKDADKIIEEVNALIAECARVREEFRTCAVRLADAVTIARHESGKIQDLFGEKISAYMEADERYDASVSEATYACARTKKCVISSRKEEQDGNERGNPRGIERLSRRRRKGA